MKRSLRKILLLVGDIGVLYLSLFLLVFIRYGNDWQVQWDNHFTPFSLIFPIWIATLYGSYLYEARFFRPSIDALRAMGIAVFLSIFGSIAAFYLFPPGLIQPRKNMVIFAAIFGILLVTWRYLAYKVAKTQIETNVLFLGNSKEVRELLKFFKDNPDLRYTNRGVIEKVPTKFQTISEQIEKDKIGLVVVQAPEKSNYIKHLFPFLATGITVIELEEFYERLLNKVSPEMINDTWFIRNLEDLNLGAYELGKRSMDILIGVLGIVLLIIFYIPVALAIKLDSKGPIIFRQKRVSKNGQTFWMYKFRTMKALTTDGSAETKGASWTKKNDKRVTKIGQILRVTRIDELPQFWNILRGDLSFVGPRPERPEFVEELSEEIPYYNMRHLVKPGLTGWAQINYGYGSSITDARAKLQYDIYYAKKRSLMLDIAILLKTVKIILTRQGR